MEASNASPIAVAVSVISCICSMSPLNVLWMVCRVCCIMVAVPISGGNWATICGNRAFISPIPPTISSMPPIIADMFVCSAVILSLNVFTPSMASNADRIPSQAGMLKQCCSQ